MPSLADGNSSLTLSDYEKQRLSNIERNNAQLKLLGLISAAEELRSNCAAARPAAIKKKRSTTADSSDEDYSEEDSGDEQGKLIAGSSSRKRKRRKVSASTTTLTQSRFRPQAERCLIVRSRRRLRGSHVVSEAKSPTAPSLPCRWAQRKSSKREERG